MYLQPKFGTIKSFFEVNVSNPEQDSSSGQYVETSLLYRVVISVLRFLWCEVLE